MWFSLDIRLLMEDTHIYPSFQLISKSSVKSIDEMKITFFRSCRLSALPFHIDWTIFLAFPLNENTHWYRLESGKQSEMKHFKWDRHNELDAVWFPLALTQLRSMILSTMAVSTISQPYSTYTLIHIHQIIIPYGHGPLISYNTASSII